MNPSAPGWIEKFFQITSKSNINNIAFDEFYQKIRKCGFIYGHVVSLKPIDFPLETKGWTTTERAKVALLFCQWYLYCQYHDDKKHTTDQFINFALGFYNQLQTNTFYNPILSLLPQDTKSKKLEAVIGERVQTNQHFLTKNFSHILTNALIFIDVLAFRHYILGVTPIRKYISKLEKNLISVVAEGFNHKLKPSKYDRLLIKLLESSVRYVSSKDLMSANHTPDLTPYTHVLERHYILDIAAMAVWSDREIDVREVYYLTTLGTIFELNENDIKKTIGTVNDFLNHHEKEIPYFNYSNPLKHFYNQTSQQVWLLVQRNRKRLIKEIYESKDLLKLLIASTQRDLTSKEKKQVKNQLLDICKTIPSLSIFILPGGSLLLPLLIKFIHRLLPSSFNENLDQ